MRYEIHVHSVFSDGAGAPREIVEHAKRMGLNGVVITDHDVIDGSLEAVKYATPDFTIIPGMEVSSKDGHILALNVRTLVARGLSAKETVDLIHAQGGLAIAAHPYDSWRRGVGDLILNAGFDAVEIVNGHTIYNKKDVVKICREHRIPMTGGSDAHLMGEIGSVVVECEKPLLEAIKSGELRILSRSKAGLFYNHLKFTLKRKLK